MSIMVRAAACVGLAFLLVHCGDAVSGTNDNYFPGGDDSGTDAGKKADSGKGGKKDSGGGGADSGGGVGDDAGDDDDDDDDDDASPPGDDDDDDDDAGGGADTGAHPAACPSPVGNEDPGQYPQTDFDPQPSYIPNDTLVLTLDDGPDTTQTPKILDLLKARGIKATFFVNTENWGGPDSLIKRMIDEGHEIGNHTVHHSHLQTLASSAIETEITGVETVVSSLTGGTIKKLTLLRAPYGEPYQDGPVATPANQSLVFPVVARHAVAINWNFDTQDSDLADGTAVFNSFKGLVKTPGAAGAAWGIFLMHTVHPQDVDALPLMLDYIKANHFKMIRVEDVLCRKFGKHSVDLVP